MTNPQNGARSRTGACIVGGGPAGMLLGLLLAKRGADVIVLEGHDTFDREFRGEVLQPSAARLLDQIGLLPYILEQQHLTLIEGRLLVGHERAGFRCIVAETLKYFYLLFAQEESVDPETVVFTTEAHPLRRTW